MSLRYRNSQGDETHVAGLNGQNGSLVPSVALQQSGTVTFSCGANIWNTVDVTFATPMPDTDYLVNTDSGETSYVHVQVATSKRTTGFTMIIWNRDDILNTGIIRWTAFKLMTDTVHEADAARIAQNTANFAPAFSEVTSYAVGDYVTYNNVLYRCTTAHTAGVWVAGHFTQVTVGGELPGPTIIGQATNVGGSTGAVYYYKSGKVVTVRFNGFTCEGDGTNKKVLTGLPAPISTLFFQLSGNVKNNTFDIDADGNIYADVSITSTISIWDTFTYVCR